VHAVAPDRPSVWHEGSERQRTPVSFYYEEIWMSPGPHVGRGPRGYQRTDDRIREDVCERLTQHGRIDASDIEVTVAQGEVTLRGRVDSRDAKRQAEAVAESVSGVRDVRNELRAASRELDADRRRSPTPGAPAASAQPAHHRPTGSSSIVEPSS
jgi:hypothetical protein